MCSNYFEIPVHSHQIIHGYFLGAFLALKESTPLVKYQDVERTLWNTLYESFPEKEELLDVVEFIVKDHTRKKIFVPSCSVYTNCFERAIKRHILLQERIAHVAGGSLDDIYRQNQELIYKIFLLLWEEMTISVRLDHPIIPHIWNNLNKISNKSYDILWIGKLSELDQLAATCKEKDIIWFYASDNYRRLAIWLPSTLIDVNVFVQCGNYFASHLIFTEIDDKFIMVKDEELFDELGSNCDLRMFKLQEIDSKRSRGNEAKSLLTQQAESVEELFTSPAEIDIHERVSNFLQARGHQIDDATIHIIQHIAICFNDDVILESNFQEFILESLDGFDINNVPNLKLVENSIKQLMMPSESNPFKEIDEKLMETDYNILQEGSELLYDMFFQKYGDIESKELLPGFCKDKKEEDTFFHKDIIKPLQSTEVYTDLVSVIDNLFENTKSYPKYKIALARIQESKQVENFKIEFEYQAKAFFQDLIQNRKKAMEQLNRYEISLYQALATYEVQSKRNIKSPLIQKNIKDLIYLIVLFGDVMQHMEVVHLLLNKQFNHKSYIKTYEDRIKALFNHYINPYKVTIKDNKKNKDCKIYEIKMMNGILAEALSTPELPSDFKKPGNEVRIICTNNLFVEDNTELKKEDFHGMNVSIIACKIIGVNNKPGERSKLFIDVSGLDSTEKYAGPPPRPQSDYKPDGSGVDGLHGGGGYPGESAGNILIVTNNKGSADYPECHFSADGGNGSDGQDGGNAKNGKDGKDGNEGEMHSFFEEWKGTVFRASGCSFRQANYGTHAVVGTAGGSGGRPGCGGMGGYAGQIETISTDENPPIRKIQCGQIGSVGKAG